MTKPKFQQQDLVVMTNLHSRHMNYGKVFTCEDDEDQGRVRLKELDLTVSTEYLQKVDLDDLQRKLRMYENEIQSYAYINESNIRNVFKVHNDIVFKMRVNMIDTIEILKRAREIIASSSMDVIQRAEMLASMDSCIQQNNNMVQ